MSAADAVAVFAKKKLGEARERAREAWAEFRAESGYFQVRVALVLAYALIVLVTILVVPPPPVEYEVTLQKVSFGLGDRTIVEFKNLRLGDLEPARVVVHGEGKDPTGRMVSGPFEVRYSILPEGEKVTIHTDKMRDALSRPAPPAIDVSRVQVYDGDDLVVDHDAKAPKR